MRYFNIRYYLDSSRIRSNNKFLKVKIEATLNSFPKALKAPASESKNNSIKPTSDNKELILLKENRNCFILVLPPPNYLWSLDGYDILRLFPYSLPVNGTAERFWDTEEAEAEADKETTDSTEGDQEDIKGTKEVAEFREEVKEVKDATEVKEVKEATDIKGESIDWKAVD